MPPEKIKESIYAVRDAIRKQIKVNEDRIGTYLISFRNDIATLERKFEHEMRLDASDGFGDDARKMDIYLEGNSILRKLLDDIEIIIKEIEKPEAVEPPAAIV